MSRVVVVTNVTLDGVMQAPGSPDEDRRDGFAHGGWAAPYAAMQHLGGDMADGGLLFGRRTYENFAAVWPQRTGNPFTEVLNNKQKFVASTTLRAPLSWMNSTLLEGDATAAVAKLKDELGYDLVILGSGVLIQSLLRANLIDEYTVLIHPLVLGSGRRLFPTDGTFARLRLVSSKATDNGVVIASYRPNPAGP